MMNMQKSKLKKHQKAWYQIVPYTFKLLLIMNSNVNEMIVKLMTYAATAKPLPASTQISGM